MGRNDRHMEELFHTQMESFKVDPSPGLWQKVHARIVWKQFLKFNFRTFNAYYLAAAITIAGIGSYALLSDRENAKLDQASGPASAAGTKIQEPSGDITAAGAETIQITEEETQALRMETGDGKSGQGETTKRGNEDGENIQPVPATPVRDAEQQASPAPEKTAGDETGIKSETIIVTAGFEASMPSGCAPLAIRFENLSENAVQYGWFFGDGGSSAEKDPLYVFDEPGEYAVVLKILGADGSEYSAERNIRVFETPKALFEMDDAVDLSAMQPVYFYNFSRNADFYEWDFGDQQHSNLAEPIHYYERPGTYNVKLKVWTKNQCYDSLILLNAFTGAESGMRFPTAFTPNMTGPTGGYYDLNDVNNTVFHPVVTGDLTEYQLKIFNRQGLLIFESKDVSIGWDGYYQEKLAAQAVYIWKARGKFSNGKTFVKSGDVTLIRQY